MQVYKWKLVGVGTNQWSNHVFPEHGKNIFISICGQRYVALNGENTNKTYCTTCDKKLPVFQHREMKREQARIGRLEMKRDKIISKISAILQNIPIDDLTQILSSLTRK